MPHALSVTSPRTLAVLLSSLVAVACSKDEPKKPEAKVGAAPTADGKDGGKLGTEPGAAPDLATPPAPSSSAASVKMGSGGTIYALQGEPDVLGHFAIASPSKLLADIRTQLVLSLIHI